MNLILFDEAETRKPLPADDQRARHIREILRRHPGQQFDCGLIDGPRGRATVERDDDGTGMRLRFEWSSTPPAPLPPIHLMVGMARPQTVRKILREVTALGIARITFFQTERGEPSYADSSLWKGNEVRRLLIEGAEQAFCTRLPLVDTAPSLGTLLDRIPETANRLALDNYEASTGLNRAHISGDTPSVVAIGSERGWSAEERELLRSASFQLAHLGERVLRTETACVAAIALIRARLGLYD